MECKTKMHNNQIVLKRYQMDLILCLKGFLKPFEGDENIILFLEFFQKRSSFEKTFWIDKHVFFFINTLNELEAVENYIISTRVS